MEVGRKKMRKKSNEATGVGALVRQAMWESGITIYSKHRLNNIENVKSKLQPTTKL